MPYHNKKGTEVYSATNYYFSTVLNFCGTAKIYVDWPHSNSSQLFIKKANVYTEDYGIYIFENCKFCGTVGKEIASATCLKEMRQNWVSRVWKYT